MTPTHLPYTNITYPLHPLHPHYISPTPPTSLLHIPYTPPSYRPCTKSPDAITAYNKNMNINEILNGARRMEHKSIVSFHNLRRDVFTELTMSEEMQGIKVS